MMTGYAGCFRIRFSGLRLVYAIKGETIWLIILDKRKKVYKEMAKRIKGL
jgi:mRNA-degrading endonuclease RelE of RelBE toxin-antitoxin system